MRLEFSIDAKGLGDLIDGLENAVRFRGPVGEAIGEILRQDARKQFEVGGNPRWQPLALTTIRQKRAMGYPRLTRQGLVPMSMVQSGGFGPSNILERTGRLLEGWTKRNSPEHVSRIEDGKVTEGTSVPYAVFHQKGGKGGKRPPMRPIVITEEAMRLAAEALAKGATS